MDAVPDLSENQVMVFAEWAGHGPLEVERRVTRRISQALQALPQVAAVRGSSDMGYALVHVIFEDAISPEEARQALQERLSGVSSSLPPGVVPQLAAEGIATGQIYWYTVESSSASLVELRRIQDEQIAPLLSTVPGVSEVAGVGGFHAELQVQANPALLVQRGLSV
ncbi:MAG: efflux RND transporter permease subunit, partial [Planctomycetaceae bacterium]